MKFILLLGSTNLIFYKPLRYPTFFDDIAARLLPVIPLIVYRLIENDAMDSADRVLATYSSFLAYYPLRFSFVRDILAYFYGHLPGKLIVRILNVFDLSKVIYSSFVPFPLVLCFFILSLHYLAILIYCIWILNSKFFFFFPDSIF